VTGSFGWRFNWDYGLSMFASYGNAFKAPTFNQLYFPGFGNPNLTAEQSQTAEVGFAGNHDWLNWEIRGYHTDINNLIAVFPVKNINKAQIIGLETEVGIDLLGWHNQLGFQFLNPRDRTTDQRLQRRAQKIMTYDLSRSFGSFDLGSTVMARGDSFEDAANTQKIAGFVTVDLRAAYHFNKNWRISAKLKNLLDKQYQLVKTYNTADRNFFISIHYNN